MRYREEPPCCAAMLWSKAALALGEIGRNLRVGWGHVSPEVLLKVGQLWSLYHPLPSMETEGWGSPQTQS